MWRILPSREGKGRVLEVKALMDMDVIGWRSPHIYRSGGYWFVYFRGERHAAFAFAHALNIALGLHP